MKISNIYWLAGLLEGEGCFTFNSRLPMIKIEMTDKDVIVVARNIVSPAINITTRIQKPRFAENYKPLYGFQINGSKAVQWMMTLYSLMGERRKSRIKEVLNEWKSIPVHKSDLSLRARRAIYRNKLRNHISPDILKQQSGDVA